MMPRKQSGATLIVAMIFLIVIALIGVSLAGSTMTEEKTTRNFRDREIAFTAAEAALRDAELRLTGGWCWIGSGCGVVLNTNLFDANCVDGLCDSLVTLAGGAPQDTVDFYAKSSTGGDAATIIGTVTGSPTVQGIPTANQPRYRIEVIPTVFGDLTNPTPVKAYRITAQAKGQLDTSKVTLQEIYLPSDSTN